MKIRISGYVLAIVAIVGFSGCPGAGGSLAGTWIFEMSGSQFGVTLMPNGEATSFVIDFAYNGTLTWHRHGDQFVMDQIQDDGCRIIYSALISNDGTFLEGARVGWVGPDTGLSLTFDAMKAP